MVSFGKTSCPWECDNDEIIYFENEYNSLYNNLITQTLAEHGEEEAVRNLAYLPELNRQIDTTFPQNLQYMLPQCADTAKIRPEKLTYQMLASALPPTDIWANGPCLISLFYKDGELDLIYKNLESQNVGDFIDELAFFADTAKRAQGKAPKPQICPPDDEIYFYIETEADDTFESEVLQDLLEIKEKIDSLRMKGISGLAIRKFVGLDNEIEPGRLTIDKHYNIILPDYGNRVIELEPLPKVVFLLFLRHPEGIMFKELPDYKHEVECLYEKVTGRTDKGDIMISIDRLVSPTDNSINEKCSKIKRAFVSAVCDEAAQWYYVDGLRGKPKSIRLPRELVSIEAPDFSLDLPKRAEV